MQTRRFVMPVAVASLVLGAAFVSAQPENTPARGQPAGQGGERPRGPGRGDPNAVPQSLDAAMKSINRGFRTLRRQIDKPDMREANLQILSDMQRAAVAAKAIKPPHAPADGQEAYFDAYRLEQIEFVSLLLRAEGDLVKKDFAAAAKAVTEMTELRDSAHKQFAPEEAEEDQKEENGGK